MTDISDKQAERKIFLFAEICKLLDQENWSTEIALQAEKKCNLDRNYHKLLFPGGLSQMVQEFENWLDTKMLDSLSKIDRPKKIREQIALAIETRIINIVPKNIVLHNSSFFLIPTNILAGSESSCQTCDLIWKYAGDKSTDYNYYTKRGLLLPVYISAKAFYIADNSKDHEKTKEFIKNALDNIINIASFKNRVKMPKMEDIPIVRLFL
jgi:ubiquinone biosynthesis protein COQ9